MFYLNQCIVYWIDFQNISTFLHNKKHSFWLAFKIVKSLQCILSRKISNCTKQKSDRKSPSSLIISIPILELKEDSVIVFFRIAPVIYGWIKLCYASVISVEGLEPNDDLERLNFLFQTNWQLKKIMSPVKHILHCYGRSSSTIILLKIG